MQEFGILTAFMFILEPDRKRSKRVILMRRYCVTKEDALQIRNQFCEANNHLDNEAIYEWQPYPEKL